MNLRVLVVDDSMIMRKNIRKMLEELGHTVITEAKNGEDAVISYTQSLPDLVTMDITMPVVDGIEATRLIKASYPDALIIMITSHGQENLVIDAIKAGAKGYILKPLTQVKIDTEILKLFKNKKITSETDDSYDLDLFDDDFLM